jgi:hypothetical protein
MFLNVAPAAQPSVIEPSQTNAPTISGGTPSFAKDSLGLISSYALVVDRKEKEIMRDPVAAMIDDDENFELVLVLVG